MNPSLMYPVWHLTGYCFIERFNMKIRFADHHGIPVLDALGTSAGKEP